MEPLSISLFGPFEVKRGDTLITRFRSDALRALLAILAIERGRPQRRETLAHLLSPDRPDAEALTYLRNRLTRLRKTIGDDQAEPPYFEINRKEILLHDHVQVDVAEFEATLQAVRHHPHRELSACPTCIANLTAASQLYRGHLLEGLSLENEIWQNWLTTQRERLKVDVLDLFGKLSQVESARGEWESVLDLGRRTLELDPWREAAYRHLMRASFALGDRAGALGWYEACEKILYEELGADPDEETLALHAEISEGALLVSAGLAATIPDNLPIQTTRFFGRESEKAQVLERLVHPNHRLITLVGEGGIGKTRLSLEIGAAIKGNFPDGVWFVPLADATEGMERLKIAVGEAIGLGDGEKQLSGEQVIAVLRNKRLLLIMDNSETALDDIAFFPEWLKRAPGVAILASSREPLNFEMETVVQLHGLPIGGETLETAGAALRLFEERGQRSQSRFELNEETLPLAKELCELVGGSPLAIGLAAAWLRRRPLPKILESVHHSIDFLTSRMRDADPRHRSMRAVFETSWEMLEPEDQTIFAALSIFPSRFSEAAAEGITGATLFDLDLLCEKSLLQQEIAEERYLMHGLLRQFAGDKLEEAQIKPLQQAFVDFFYRFAAEHQSSYEQLKPEWPNLSAAITRAAELEAWERVLDFSDRLAKPWFEYCLTVEANHGYDLAAQAAITLSDEPRLAMTHLRWAEIQLEQNRYDDAWEKLTQAEETFFRLESTPEIAKAKYLKGNIFFDRGHLQDAEKILLDAKSHQSELADTADLAETIDLLGWVYFEMDETLERAEETADQVLALNPVTAPQTSTISSLRRAAYVKQRQNRLNEAEMLAQQAVELATMTNKPGEKGAALNILVALYLKLERFSEAQRLVQQSIDTFRKIGNIRFESMALHNKSVIFSKTGRNEEALELTNQTLDIYESIEDRIGYGFSLRQRGDIYSNLGQPTKAQAEWREGLKLATHLNHPQLISVFEERLSRH